jgi:hypothetical protein
LHEVLPVLTKNPEKEITDTWQPKGFFGWKSRKHRIVCKFYSLYDHYFIGIDKIIHLEIVENTKANLLLGAVFWFTSPEYDCSSSKKRINFQFIQQPYAQLTNIDKHKFLTIFWKQKNLLPKKNSIFVITKTFINIFKLSIALNMVQLKRKTRNWKCVTWLSILTLFFFSKKKNRR